MHTVICLYVANDTNVSTQEGTDGGNFPTYTVVRKTRKTSAPSLPTPPVPPPNFLDLQLDIAGGEDEDKYFRIQNPNYSSSANNEPVYQELPDTIDEIKQDLSKDMSITDVITTDNDGEPTTMILSTTDYNDDDYDGDEGNDEGSPDGVSGKGKKLMRASLYEVPLSVLNGSRRSTKNKN